MACPECGSLEEVEGDFVAYQASSASNTSFSGANRTTITQTKYFNVTPFSFRACLECTRSKLFAELLLSKRITYIFLCIGVLCLPFGIYGLNVFPPRAEDFWRMASTISFVIGLFALGISLFLGYGGIYELKELIAGFPSDRVKISSILLKLYKKRVNACAQSHNPSSFKEDRYFAVVSQQEWTTKFEKKDTPDGGMKVNSGQSTENVQKRLSSEDVAALMNILNTAGQPETFQSSQEKALLYVYRYTQGLVGAAASLEVTIDDRYIGNTTNMSYMQVEVNPGICRIYSKGKKENGLELNVEKGKVYFILQQPKLGLIAGSSKFNLVSEAQGKAEIKSCTRLIGRTD
jgi:hypothetical protein